MKKFLTTSIFLLGSAAMAQSSLQLYGNADIGLTYIDNSGGKSSTSIGSGISKPSRLGFRGTEDLGNGNKVSFVMESGLNVATGAAGDSSGMYNREASLSLQIKGLGLIKAGRIQDFIFADLGVLDSTPLIQGGMTSGFTGFSNPYGSKDPQPAVDPHYSGAKFNKAIKWIGNYGNFRTGLMYGRGANQSSDKMFSVMARYSQGGFSIGSAYTKSNYTNSVFAREVWVVKTQYIDKGTIYFANYADAKDPVTNARNRPLEVGVQYTLSPTWKAGFGYGHAWATAPNGRKAQIHQPFVGAKYILSKRTELYGMAAFNRTSNKNVIAATVGIPGGASQPSTSSSMNVLRFGILHNF